jgi:alpha-L-fucosidase
MIEDQRIAEAAAVRPSARQLAWQQLEFYGFIHFGINTMTDREWGLGHEDPALFNPQHLDARQWVQSLKSAGMRGLILTCKHHDGFCLWPSTATRHSVAASPWRGGQGDLVAEVAAACAAEGLKFGVYLSPWDRTEPSYGSGSGYDAFFLTQLRELLTGYGPIFSVWFDGANGEGPNGKVQLYDWDRYFALVRELQPDAVISVCGPDVRWCGNEAGHTRENEWSVVPASLRDAERIASRSQQADDGQFARLVRSDEDDLGSRAAITSVADPLVWYPAEVNTSIRPGWFYHRTEDAAVRPAAELFEIYRRSVGGNATFLLNVPPDATGRVAVPDVAVLQQLGRLIAELSARDISAAAEWQRAGSGFFPGKDLPSGTDSGAPSLTLSWAEPVLIDGLVLGEDITQGQQIDQLTVSVRDEAGAEPRQLVELPSIGYRRVVDFAPLRVTELTLRVVQARGPVAISTLAVLRPSTL